MTAAGIDLAPAMVDSPTMTAPRRRRTGKPGRPRLNPNVPGDGKVTWIYGDGQLDLIRSWADEDDVEYVEALRTALDVGMARPFPKSLVDEELAKKPWQRVGQAKPAELPDGVKWPASPHYKFRPGPGQLEKLDARRGVWAGLSRNQAIRIAVRVAARRRSSTSEDS